MTNIVLLVVDTLRDKDLEQKGEEIAPFLTKMGKENIKIENYYSNASWTAPAHASMFTGELPSSHGTTTENPFFEKENKLVKTMKGHGYKTIGLSENEWVSGFSGLDQGFDEFKHYSIAKKGGEVWKETWDKDSEFEDMSRGRTKKWLYFLKRIIQERDTESTKTFVEHLHEKLDRKFGWDEEADYNPRFDNAVIDQAISQLEDSNEKFLFMNLMPVHAKYTFDKQDKEKFAPKVDSEEISDLTGKYPLAKYLLEDIKSEGFLQKRKKLYNASISYTDRQIERFYEQAPKDTIFVVIGDHGELTGEYEFNDRPIIHHHLGTFKELIDVPCYVFSKENLGIETSSEKLYDHRDITDIIESAILERSPEGRGYTNAEYHGHKGLAQFRNKEVSENIKGILGRKSFSILDIGVKYDLASDGAHYWDNDRLTEKIQIDREEVRDTLVRKNEILYQHYFN